ncbi:hypothetical protein NLB33_16465 [Mycolicibacterium smegmatis]|uniref:putative alpha/beta hydrolase n=1 Tax=Mycolicibacterium smegmatis TaxID=1772 RepID=UPI001E41A2DF|nr:hypothetical protein [Mycolicibacterium smegmatis]MCP2624445.1 hypothetical protein [Mycolicibacterium smegmatis]UGU28631.1 hypothetical protein LT350_18640 [Mycolicibacterium smegmatis]ULN69623.1 hypothetical protein KZ782_29175 [Mycolicibacterium smegmatis]
MTLQLKRLSLQDLISSAGGDPWKTNKSLQSGSPGEISELATSFYKAGSCTQEITDEFNAAKQRFEAAWDRHDGGDHPINDAAEVRRATESLHLSWEQMAKVAVDLQNISASLAEAQQSSDQMIIQLESALQTIDNQIDMAILEAEANGETVDWSDLKEAAVERTREGLHGVEAVRDHYAEQLSQSSKEMAAEGYSPDATSSVDGQGENPNPGQSDGHKYGETQRSADESLVSTPGEWTAEKQAAASRLRDHDTLNNPSASLDERRYAGERLNDYFTAQASGPLPVDPVLGGNARTRAQSRLEMQAKLEQGLLGAAPMTPDQATAMLDNAEVEARGMVVARVEQQLEQAGMTAEGAAQAAQQMSHGIIPPELVNGASAAGKVASGLDEGFTRTADALPTGDHWKPSIDTYSPSDIEALRKIGGKLGAVGTLVDLGVGLYDYNHGVPLGEIAAKTGGGMAGAWGLGALGAEIGVVGGPPGVFLGAVTFGTIGAIYGEKGGELVYKWLTDSP